MRSTSRTRGIWIATVIVVGGVAIVVGVLVWLRRTAIDEFHARAAHVMGIFDSEITQAKHPIFSLVGGIRDSFLAAEGPDALAGSQLEQTSAPVYKRIEDGLVGENFDTGHAWMQTVSPSADLRSRPIRTSYDWFDITIRYGLKRRFSVDRPVVTILTGPGFQSDEVAARIATKIQDQGLCDDVQIVHAAP